MTTIVSHLDVRMVYFLAVFPNIGLHVHNCWPRAQAFPHSFFRSRGKKVWVFSTAAKKAVREGLGTRLHNCTVGKLQLG